MAGVIIPIVPMRDFTFNGVVPGGQQHLVIANRIDVSRYVDAVLIVRLHNIDVEDMSTITFSLIPDGFTADDPGLQFFGLPTPIQVVVNDGDISRSLRLSGGTIHGQYVALTLDAFRDATDPMIIAFFATVSIDLLLRTPDEE